MIRKADKKDLTVCVDVIRSSFLTVAEEFGFTEENAPRFTAFAVNIERLETQFSQGRPMYVYVDDFGKIIGYYSLLLSEQEQGKQNPTNCQCRISSSVQKECELNNLCVLPEYRHKKIGEALLKHAFETAFRSGCKKVRIGIVEENTKLRNWYERYGAVHTGTRKFDFFPFTCGYMVKDIEEILYRKLNISDLDSFIDMRIMQLQEEGAEPTVDLKPSLYDYYNRHLSDGTFVSWLAVRGDEIIGTSGMSFVEKPPYYTNPSGKIGLLSSMYTKPEYRRMGIAKALLDKVVDEARAYGCGTVHITASDVGVLLYTDYGFERNGNFMQYQL